MVIVFDFFSNSVYCTVTCWRNKGLCIHPNGWCFSLSDHTVWSHPLMCIYWRRSIKCGAVKCVLVDSVLISAAGGQIIAASSTLIRRLARSTPRPCHSFTASPSSFRHSAIPPPAAADIDISTCDRQHSQSQCMADPNRSLISWDFCNRRMSQF